MIIQIIFNKIYVQLQKTKKKETNNNNKHKTMLFV